MCNDGTSAVAYIREGYGENANKFVFRIMGGGYKIKTNFINKIQYSKIKRNKKIL